MGSHQESLLGQTLNAKAWPVGQSPVSFSEMSVMLRSLSLDTYSHVSPAINAAAAEVMDAVLDKMSS